MDRSELTNIFENHTPMEKINADNIIPVIENVLIGYAARDLKKGEIIKYSLDCDTKDVIRILND